MDAEEQVRSPAHVKKLLAEIEQSPLLNGVLSGPQKRLQVAHSPGFITFLNIKSISFQSVLIFYHSVVGRHHHQLLGVRG